FCFLQALGLVDNQGAGIILEWARSEQLALFFQAREILPVDRANLGNAVTIAIFNDRYKFHVAPLHLDTAISKQYSPTAGKLRAIVSLQESLMPRERINVHGT